MKPTQTGIAVALALVVMVLVFFPNLLSFFFNASSTASTDVTAGADTLTTQPTTPMPTDTEQPSSNPDQLQITDEVVGTGATAAAGDTVTVQYVGSLTNGAVFDASANHGSQGFTFPLGAGQVIKGWDMGVAGMKEGGKRKLVIPAGLAYGNQAIGNVIPANSTLIFEVELVKVQKGGR
jgi:FKBP-type peptidyl-prolyl cis-trans isomerase